MGIFSVQIMVPIGEKSINGAIKAIESETEFKMRSEISVIKEKGAILVNINSNDLSSLHAATGAILRALKVIISVQSKCCGKESKE